MHFKTLLPVICCVVLLLICGCSEQLRFAASESQKQIALQTHMTARAVNENGADPGSQAAEQLVDGTETALAYIGMPKSPDIEDYATTSQQARDDAVKRPVAEDVFEAAEQGLSLAAELAILFGVGGAGFGGKKLLDWLKLAREKNKALAEIVHGNELLKKSLTDAQLQLFKKAQNDAQVTPSTKVLVTELKG